MGWRCWGAASIAAFSLSAGGSPPRDSRRAEIVRTSWSCVGLRLRIPRGPRLFAACGAGAHSHRSRRLPDLHLAISASADVTSFRNAVGAGAHRSAWPLTVCGVTSIAGLA